MRTNTRKIRKLLVANRSEISILIMRAATELGISTVAIYSREDRFALHRYKADESYLVGEGRGPIEAYLDIGDIIRIATEASVDAIHPGYGFLSENPEFADACIEAGLIFIGPDGDTMRSLGSKIAARKLASKAGVPVMPATDPLPALPDGEGRADAAFGTDGAEDPGRHCPLIDGRSGPGSPFRPAPRDFGFLSNSGFVLPPNLYRGVARERGPDFRQFGGEVF